MTEVIWLDRPVIRGPPTDRLVQARHPAVTEFGSQTLNHHVDFVTASWGFPARNVLILSDYI